MKLKETLIKTLLFTALLTQSCKKNKPVEEEKPGPLANKISSEIYKNEDVNGVGILTYTYNDDGTLKKWGDYTYNYQDGKRHSGTSGDQVFTYIYTGDQVTQVVESSLETPGFLKTHTFTYNSKGFISTLKSEWDDGMVFDVERFTTDTRGNIVKIEADFYKNGVYKSTNTSTYEYDDKINVRYKLREPFSYAEYFSPNNIVKETHGIEISPYEKSYSYSYNDRNMPVQVSIGTSSLRFEYYK
jgi:hypothetical protein